MKDVIETAKRSRPLSLAPSFRGDRENAASPRNAENHADNGQGGFWGRNWDEFPANESLDENDGSYDDASTDNDDEEENNNDPQ